MDTPTLLIGVVLSAIGTAYFIYGRKQQSFVTLLAGILLFVLPFALDSPLWLTLSGIATAAAPFLLRL